MMKEPQEQQVSQENYCKRCKRYALKPKGTFFEGALELWVCSQCGLRVVRNKERQEE